MNNKTNQQKEQRDLQFLMLSTRIIMPEEGLLFDPPELDEYDWQEDDEYRETFMPRNMWD